MSEHWAIKKGDVRISNKLGWGSRDAALDALRTWRRRDPGQAYRLVHITRRPSKEALNRIASLEAEVHRLENIARRRDVPSDGEMLAELSKDKLARDLDDARKERDHKHAKWQEWMAACQEARAEVERLTRDLAARIDGNRALIQTHDAANARIAELEKGKLDAYTKGYSDRDQQIRTDAWARIDGARRDTIEECAKICHYQWGHCGGAMECEQAIRALLTDDGKGEAK